MEKRWETRLLDLFGWMVILLMVLVCVQVAASVAGINPLIEFGRRWPLVGEAITLDSLLDAQWHLLAAIALLPAAIAWRRDTHVRVDFLYRHLSQRARLLVEVLGHLALTLPFLLLAVPASWRFAVKSFVSHEGSANAGLIDRFLVKGLMPLGLAALLVVVSIDLLLQLRRLARRAPLAGSTD